MKIIHLALGTGHLLCGSSRRDELLVRSLRRLGHEVVVFPLVLPGIGDDPSWIASDAPVHFGLRSSQWLSHPLVPTTLAKVLARRLDAPGRMRQYLENYPHPLDPQAYPDLLVNLLRCEQGPLRSHQARLIQTIRRIEAPDVVTVSNLLLAGLARQITGQLRLPVVAMLHGELPMLNHLPGRQRQWAWRLLAQRSQDLAGFVAQSSWYANVMRDQLQLDADRTFVVEPGLDMPVMLQHDRPANHNAAADSVTNAHRDVDSDQPSDGGDGKPNLPRASTPHASTPHPSTSNAQDQSKSSSKPAHLTVGYLARLADHKGLGQLVHAFIELSHRAGAQRPVQLILAGSTTPRDRRDISRHVATLSDNGLADRVRWQPNMTATTKLNSLMAMDVVVAAPMPERDVSLSMLEAWAMQKAVVAPSDAGCGELIQRTRAAQGYDPNDPHGLMLAIEKVIQDAPLRRRLGETGARIMRDELTARRFADQWAQVLDRVCSR